MRSAACWADRLLTDSIVEVDVFEEGANMKNAMLSLASGVLAALALPAVVYAHAGNDSPTMVHACVNPSGLVKLVAPSGNCKGSEQPFHWSISGPAGPKGDRSLEDPFLNALRKERIPVSIYLVNGIQLQGQIGSFDQHVVLLRNSVTQMVYKHAISTVVPSRTPTLPTEPGG